MCSRISGNNISLGEIWGSSAVRTHMQWKITNLRHRINSSANVGLLKSWIQALRLAKSYAMQTLVYKSHTFSHKYTPVRTYACTSTHLHMHLRKKQTGQKGAVTHQHYLTMCISPAENFLSCFEPIFHIRSDVECLLIGQHLTKGRNSYN